MTDGPAEPRISVRPARAADRPLLEAFMARLQDHERALGADLPPGRAIASEHVGALLKWVAGHPAGAALLALDGDTPAGMLILGVTAESGFHLHERHRIYGEISDLWVERDRRGRGIARALIAAAEARLLGHGIRRVTVSAIAENAEARDTYGRLGYRLQYRSFERLL